MRSSSPIHSVLQCREMAQRSTFLSWKFSHYFEYVCERDKNNITVRCKLCPDGRTLSTARNSTSNLKKHLQARHNNTHLQARPEEEQEQPEQQEEQGGGDAAPSQTQITPSLIKSDSPPQKEIKEETPSCAEEKKPRISTVERIIFH